MSRTQQKKKKKKNRKYYIFTFFNFSIYFFFKVYKNFQSKNQMKTATLKVFAVTQQNESRIIKLQEINMQPGNKKKKISLHLFFFKGFEAYTDI